MFFPKFILPSFLLTPVQFCTQIREASSALSQFLFKIGSLKHGFFSLLLPPSAIQEMFCYWKQKYFMPFQDTPFKQKQIVCLEKMRSLYQPCF